MKTPERTPVETAIGFADGEITSMRMHDDELVVYVRAWNDAVLEVRFAGVIGMRQASASDISDLVSVKPGGELWRWSLRRAYEDTESGRGENLYQFIDNDDDASLEVVASEATVTVVLDPEVTR